MRGLKKILLTLLTVALLVCMQGEVLRAAESNSEEVKKQSTADNMNFDVIFAIDGSGSMKKSDQLKLRLTAGRLFTELAASDTSRAGFVQFSNVIMDSAGLTNLAKEENKEDFRNRLAGLKDSVKGTWDTDISLGLTESLRILKEGNSFGNNRNPMIILLSDGNTDLPNGPRTVEESNAELATTLSEAAKLGVPIYSIGLNWDGKLDIANMENIASQTGGKFYNITKASDFNQYITQIFGNVADGDGTALDVQYVNGRYETPFVIDNSSVLTANIVILTDKGVSDPQLTDSDGNNVPLDAEHGVIVATDVSDANHVSTYTILKIMYPKQGAWKVSVKGEADDAVKVNLLTTYDISFMLSGGKDAVAKQDVKLTGRLTRADEVIKDADLLKGATATCTIIDNKGKIVGENLPMTFDEEKKIFTYTTNLEKSGNYYVTAQMEGKDGIFSKKSSQFQLSVGFAPLEIQGDVNCSMWCSPIKTKASFDLSDVVSCESLSELTCEPEDSGLNIADVNYNKDTGEVRLTPLKTGKQTLVLNIADNNGQSDKLTVNINVKPSWIWFVIGAVILAVIGVVIIIILKKSKPLLKEPLTVELTLPPRLAGLTPSPAILTMPTKKSEVILSQLIQRDQMAMSTFGDPIMQAGLGVLLEKIKLIACKGEAITVKIMPKVQGMVLMNNQNIDPAKGAVCQLRKGTKLGIQFSADGANISIVHLQLGQGNDAWGDNGTIFGGGNAGDFGGQNNFGSPFGGGQNNFGSPFGSGQNSFGNPFGGNQDSFGNSSFGGGFGENSNSGSEFGGNSNTGDNFGENTNGGSDFSGNANVGGGFGENTDQGGFGNSDQPKGNSGFDFGGGSNGQGGSDDGFGGFF